MAYIYNEIPTGTYNGSNQVFTLAYTPQSGSVTLYVNGLLQEVTTDYTIVGATISFILPPLATDHVRAFYESEAISMTYGDNLAWLEDSSNHIRRAGTSITTSTEDATYPADNLIVLPISKPWRSDGIAETGEWILIDFGMPRAVDCAAIINHNLTSAATIVVTAGSTSACASYTMSPAVAWAEDNAYSVIASAQTYRYWKFTFTDDSNLDGYIRVGYLMLGSVEQIATNYAYGWSESHEYINVENYSDLLIPHVAAMSRQKRYSLNWRNATTAVVAVLSGLVKTTRRNAIPLLVIPDTSNSDCYFGRWVNNPRISAPEHYSYRDIDMEFLEDPRGRETTEDDPFFYRAGDSLEDAIFARVDAANQMASDLEIEEIATNEARDAHYQVSATRGLLLEGARSNSITAGQDLTNVAWTAGNCTVAVNVDEAPDGEVTCDAIVEAVDVAQSHWIVQDAPACTNDTNQAFSFYAKPYGRNYCCVATVDANNDSIYSYINLSTGAVVTEGAGHDIRVEEAANSFWRITCIWDSDAGATTRQVGVYISDNGAQVTYNGDGLSGICIWGAMFEADANFSTSYHTSARSADVLYWDFEDSPRQFTGYIRFLELGTVGTANAAVMYIGNAAGSGMRCLISSSGSFYQITLYNSTTSVNSIMASAPVIGDTVELRWTMKSDGKVQIHQSINGAAETNGAQSGALGGAGLEDDWSDDRIYLNSVGSSNTGFTSVQAAMVLNGSQTLATCRAQ